MKKIIFVLSASYCGSTMLDLMLGNTDKGFSCGEVWAYFRPYRHRHSQAICSCFSDDCWLWRNIKNKCMEFSNIIPERNLYNVIFDNFKNISYIVDSSKDINWVLDQVTFNKDKEIYFVIVFKDPKWWYFSVLNRKYSVDNLQGYMCVYKTYINNILNKFTENTIVVHLKELLQSPEKYIKGICTWAGIEYKEGQELFWNMATQHHILYGNDSTKLHLAKRGSDIYNELARKQQEDKRNIPLEISYHRTIYYKDSWKQREVPIDIETVLKSTQMIEILDILYKHHIII